MIGWILFAVLLCAGIAVVSVDLVPTLRTWLSRIGIGSLSEPQAKDAVRAVGEKWLCHMPAVPLSDQTRFTLPERLKGTYKSKFLQSWQTGALLLGVCEQGDAAKFLNTCVNEDGSFKNYVERVDFALLAYAVLCAGEKDAQKLHASMDKVYAYLLSQVNPETGTIAYNPNIPDIRFVDTLGMICPFLSKYAAVYNVPQALELARKQMAEYNLYGMHESLCVPVHCFNRTELTPLGIYGWGRGCGWYALAAAEMLRSGCAVESYMTDFADALLKKQLPNGGWSRQILAEKSGESSATAMIGHFMAVLYSKTQDEKYKQSSQKAARFLVSCTRKNGEVDLSQGDTKGIGFYSLRLSTMPAAQGFTLLLMEETGRIQKS